MSKMILHFYKCKYGDIYDKLIGWWTSETKEKFNGKWIETYSHVEFTFCDYTYSVDPKLLEVVKLPNKYHNDKFWDSRKVKISANNDCESVISVLDTTIGDGYDTLGIVMSQIIPFAIHRKDKWTCSEHTAFALNMLNIKLLKQYNCYSPNGLYRELYKNNIIGKV